ncbi:MAG: hypothetical protein GY832_16220, partial [Chloroflexi bacterium]|nr:hypothetical protein [Chloroflexota bacterium]
VATITDNDGVFNDVPEAITYTLVYALDILTNTNYNSGSPAYFIDNSASIGTFDRVAYHMVLSDTWAYASMPAFTSTVAHIGVPVQNLGVTIAYTTSDLNFLYSSGGSGTGVYGGLEFWPNAYSPERRDEVQDENGTLVPVEDDDTFDWNDTPLTTGAYTGSLQVGYYRVQTGDETCCTVMAWNNWDTPAVDDVGFR